MKNILVIDDHPLIGVGIKALMSSYKANVYQFLNAESGLNGIIRHQPDIVIVDIYLPGLSGTDLVKTIRTLNMNLKLVVFTGYEHSELRANITKLGVDAYVLKSQFMSHLEQTITELCSLEKKDLTQKNIVDKSRNDIDKLSKQEQKILHYIEAGLRNVDIAAALSISQKTVSTHKRRIFEKLKVKNIYELLSVTSKHSRKNQE
ncbi:response regulator transcription factor [Enterobacter sichuanensis]|uniref:response regulator n=1 Tax=Enterobacter sichuanensis TaxID=2071710 RepID=UPI0021CF0F93|nr:response regulator transcription factor [Enterobacter sichuanensis]MCU6428498.1 response regulator transcription factor [Enterobacter sichuanensis]